MRALTVRQPWAWAIAHGGKDIENRTRNIAGDYRGPVAIHAGLAWDHLWEDALDDYAKPIDWILKARDFLRSVIRPPFGAVIAVADLTEAHRGPGCGGPACCWRPADVLGWVPADGSDDPHSTTVCSPWAMREHHHLMLANVRPLPNPIPAKGRLGLWTLPADVEAAVLAQIGDPS